MSYGFCKNGSIMLNDLIDIIDILAHLCNTPMICGYFLLIYLTNSNNTLLLPLFFFFFLVKVENSIQKQMHKIWLCGSTHMNVSLIQTNVSSGDFINGHGKGHLHWWKSLRPKMVVVVTGSKRINAQEKLNGTRKRKQSSDKKVASEKSYSKMKKKNEQL